MAQIFDAIIVGAGSVGVPTSMFLGRELKTVVLEAAPSPGQGQNKAAIGGVRATHSDPGKIHLGKISLEVFSTWKERYGQDIGWKSGGYAFPVYTEEHENLLKSILPVQKKHGLDINWVDAATMQEIITGINPDGLRGGTYSPGDGQVSPLLAILAFYDRARSEGTEFRFNERVIAISQKGSVFEVTTTRDHYEAPKLVLAPGANAREIGEMIDLDLPVNPDSHEAGITAPVEHFLGPLVVDLRPGDEGKTANFYFGQNSEGQIIFCYTPKPQYWGYSRENTSEFLPIVASRLIKLLPRLKYTLVRRIWRGLYPMTPDSAPIIGPVPHMPGLYLGVGMCGQGFMLGPGVGSVLTDMIMGRQVPNDELQTVLYGRSFEKDEALK